MNFFVIFKIQWWFNNLIKIRFNWFYWILALLYLFFLILKFLKFNDNLNNFSFFLHFIIIQWFNIENLKQIQWWFDHLKIIWLTIWKLLWTFALWSSVVLNVWILDINRSTLCHFLHCRIPILSIAVVDVIVHVIVHVDVVVEIEA